MPSTIPYDPTLVLGNIVPQPKLDNLAAISAIQATADAAEDNLNSLIALKRSIDMTVQELIDMNIDPGDLIKESAEVGTQIRDAAVDYAKKKVDAEKNIQPLKAKIQETSDGVESPIDYNKTEIKPMALSSDSLKMNCQYFAFDENQQSSQTHAATVAGFVSDTVDYFGESYSSDVRTSAQEQMNSQHARHSIAGTLVVSVTCTHRQAQVLAPFVLDVDKAVRVWNKVYANDMIKTNSPTNIAQAAAQMDTAKEKELTILSGATYGSCFIGMVHVLNITDTTSSETMYSIAESMQAQFNVGSWFASESGGFGVDSSFSNDAKNLLSSQKISSHCTLITLGSIPSIKSSEVAMAVKGFTDDDGAKSMAALQKIQNATADDINTIDSSATAARTGAQMISIQTAKVNAALSGLSDIDNQNNKMIDTNSMMIALDDYVDKCLAGNIGVPINFYVKPITKSQIAQMWLNKYYPNKYNAAGAGDDTAPVQPPAPGGGTQPAS
ncbi:MAG: hypothetical protein P0Y53_17785 [Candidatus Pseudobacter hemicellulosilyticus]|uniref:Uncharacterized protein n=1 Tax=Candidatus Pseudobacter hemicellulosilyticus TaxID=3121375 RepID=A0AAJ6BE84_9BACT|nr:MAG: hypothetical protein P0Y53_17785 [Pseudobacter sp.]